jgi:lipopolysaccharide/colanic/teichoic acid biosynthesis glycosyltransferase
MNVPSNGNCVAILHTNPESELPAYFRRKAWPTRAFGAVLLLFASPVILFLIVLVRLTSSGPGLYRQARSGRNGRSFMMYKLRTMYKDAEAVSGPVWCKPGDSRITPVGKVLRFLHLDELPQLVNVARGEMDLIGPRPERPEIVADLIREIPNYRARLQILPGVTGLAQINLAPDESTDCVRKKLALDCDYIREANLVMDVRILICTFLRMVGIRHGLAARWLGVKRHVTLDSTRLPRVLTRNSTARRTARTKVSIADFNADENCLAFVTASPAKEEIAYDQSSELSTPLARRLK